MSENSYILFICSNKTIRETCDDNKGVFRSHKSKKNRQYNGSSKWTNNDLQNTTPKIKDRGWTQVVPVVQYILVENISYKT